MLKKSAKQKPLMVLSLPCAANFSKVEVIKNLKNKISMLKNMNKKAARIIGKAVKSAGANAKVLNPDLDEAKLFIKKIFVDEGPTLKRLNPRARGRADRILKRTSKLTVIVSDE